MKKKVNVKICWVLVVAQLVEQSLPIPEVRGSNQAIGIINVEKLLSTVLKRQK